MHNGFANYKWLIIRFDGCQHRRQYFHVWWKKRRWNWVCLRCVENRERHSLDRSFQDCISQAGNALTELAITLSFCVIPISLAQAYHSHVFFKGCHFVMGGQTFKDYLNDVWKSCDDGVNWTPLGNASWPVRAGQAATVYNDQIIVAGGCYADPKGGGLGPPKRLFRGDVWSSPDGVKWALVTDKAEWVSQHIQANIYGRIMRKKTIQYSSIDFPFSCDRI